MDAENPHFRKKVAFSSTTFSIFVQKSGTFSDVKILCRRSEPLALQGLWVFWLLWKKYHFFFEKWDKKWYTVILHKTPILLRVLCDIVWIMRFILWYCSKYEKYWFWNRSVFTCPILTSPKIGLYLAQNWVNFEYFLNEENWMPACTAFFWPSFGLYFS